MIPNRPWCYGLSLPPRFTWSVNACQGPGEGQQRAVGVLAVADRDSRADEAVLVASEFATNAVLHSASRHGGTFTLRAEALQDYVRIEVEDAGGPWRDGPRDDRRPHGFDVVAAIAGRGNWGIDGDVRGRVAWAWIGR